MKKEETEFLKYFNADVDTIIERFLRGEDVSLHNIEIDYNLLEYECGLEDDIL